MNLYKSGYKETLERIKELPENSNSKSSSSFYIKFRRFKKSIIKSLKNMK